jgi:LacI family transcriptional regulator
MIESTRAYGRGCLMGIASYMRVHNPWNVLHLERGLVESVPNEIRKQRFDGIIARIETEKIAKAVEELNAPTVDLRGVFPPHNGVAFDTDSNACALMAVQHFLERGFKRLAFCGYVGINFSDQRQNHFADHCRSRGIECDIYSPKQERASGSDSEPDTIQRELAGELHDPRLEGWLQSLKKPIGVWGCNDVRARQVLAAATKVGIRVPDDIALLGVDDDEVVCEMTFPPLSSIEPNTHRIGFEGASQLAELMAGSKPKEAIRLIPPSRVAIRASSDIFSVEDPDVADALRFIRRRGCEAIGVADVVNATTVSRATLERRFREFLSRSPREEIERVRMERIRTLLAETSYSLEHIAELTGFGSAAHVVTAFRRHHSCTPGQYRIEQSPG